MTEINDLVAELADDVYVRGISPSQPFKPMTNNELTIEQLHAINGGGVFAKMDGFRAARTSRLSGNDDTFPINKVGIDVGPVARVGSAYPSYLM